MKRLLVLLLILIAGSGIYNADAIYGKYLFNQICEKEAGPRYYKRVEKGEGWISDVVHSEEGKKHMELWRHPDQGFFRFKDNTGRFYDARLKAIPSFGTPAETIDSSEYTLIEPANLSIPARYTTKSIKESFNPAPTWLKKQSFGKMQVQIIDLRTNEIVATDTMFGYVWTAPDRVILSGRTAVNCPIAPDVNWRNTFMEDIFKFGEKK